MFGVINGLVLRENERMETINSRLLARMPDNNVDHVYDPRPVPTRYNLMPVVDPPVVSTVPIYQKMPAPFMQNVDDESTLWNINFALQDNLKLTYVPSSTSDLYKVSIPSTSTVQTHPLLFAGTVHSQTPVHPTPKAFYNVRLKKEYT